MPSSPAPPPSAQAVVQAMTRAERHRDAGQIARSLDVLRPLLEEHRDDAGLWFLHANLCRDAGMVQEAADAYRHVILIRRGSVEAGSSLVHALITLNKPGQAAKLARNIAKVGLRLPQVARSVADAFARLSLHEEACLHYRRMLCLHPDVARGYANFAEVLARMGDDDGSLLLAARATICDPDDGQVALHHAMALLTAGSIGEGLERYESRLRPGAIGAPERPGLAAPRWDGGPLDGPLLVVAEQGLGDEIRFTAALPKLLDAGVNLIVECEQRLVALFQRSFPSIQVLPHSGRRTGTEVVYDYTHLTAQPAAYIDAGSLPLVLGLLRDRPIAETGHLIPDMSRTEAFRHFLSSQRNGPFVGMVWGSAVTHPERRRFYPGLRRLGPILTVPGIAFVNLQYIDAAKDLKRFRETFGVSVIDIEDLDKRVDLDGAAALAAACDLVVGVSSSVTAMAAAVGTPTIEMFPERSWLPRFPDASGDPRDGYLGLCRRVEFEAADRARSDGQSPWITITERTARMIPRLLRCD